MKFVLIATLFIPMLAAAHWPLHVKTAEFEKCVQGVTPQLPATKAGERHAARICKCLVNKMEKHNPSSPRADTYEAGRTSYMKECRDK